MTQDCILCLSSPPYGQASRDFKDININCKICKVSGWKTRRRTQDVGTNFSFPAWTFHPLFHVIHGDNSQWGGVGEWKRHLPRSGHLAVSGDVLVLTTWGEGGGCFWRGESRDETVGANTLYSIWDSPWQCRISHPRTQIALRNLTRRTNKWVETKTTRTLKEIPFLHGRKQGKCMRSGQLNQGWLHAHSHALCTSRGLDPSFL